MLTVVEKELKVKDYGTERLAAILGGLFLVLGSSFMSFLSHWARKILALETRR